MAFTSTHSRLQLIELPECDIPREEVLLFLQHMEGPCLIKLTQTAAYDWFSVLDWEESGKKFLLVSIGVDDIASKWKWPPDLPDTAASYFQIFNDDLGDSERSAFARAVSKKAPQKYLQAFPPEDTDVPSYEKKEKMGAPGICDTVDGDPSQRKILNMVEMRLRGENYDATVHHDHYVWQAVARSFEKMPATDWILPVPLCPPPSLALLTSLHRMPGGWPE